MPEGRLTLLSPKKSWNRLIDIDDGRPYMWRPGEKENRKPCDNLSWELIGYLKDQGLSAYCPGGGTGQERKMMPTEVAIDPVSLIIAMRNPDLLQEIYTSWMTTCVTRSFHDVKMGSYRKNLKQRIEYRSKRYHLGGPFGNVEFSENRIIVDGIFPETVIQRRLYGKLKDALENQDIPEEAVVTGIYEKEGKTVIAYDAEDILLKDVFGDEIENAFLPEGAQVEVRKVGVHG